MLGIQGLTDLKNISILHVDDDKDILLFTKMYLEKVAENLNIKQVKTPKEVIDVLDNLNYDCIISDYKMPGMNGISLATIIKKKQDIPIILYTGQGSEEVAEEAFRVGIDDYQRKESDPGHYTVLAKKINNVVERSRALKSLQQSVVTYKNVIDNATQGIIVLINSQFTYVNPRVCEISGYSKEEFMTMHFLETVKEQYRQRTVEEFAKIKEGETQDPFHIEYYTKNEGVKHLDVKGILTIWENQHAIMLYVTDLTNAEERLEQIKNSDILVECSPIA